jgi:hypothetical protein
LAVSIEKTCEEILKHTKKSEPLEEGIHEVAAPPLEEIS